MVKGGDYMIPVSRDEILSRFAGIPAVLGGDYMIPAYRDKISTCPAETDFTLRLHVEIKFHPGEAGQFSTWYLIRFACIFFGFFFVSMSFTKLKIHRFSLIKFFFT